MHHHQIIYKKKKKQQTNKQLVELFAKKYVCVENTLITLGKTKNLNSSPSTYAILLRIIQLLD